MFAPDNQKMLNDIGSQVDSSQISFNTIHHH